jgi:uncharacterized RDD family membrane protein YckC
MEFAFWRIVLEGVVFIAMPVLLFVTVYIGHMDYRGFLEKCGFGRREVGLLLVGGLVGIIMGPLGLYAVPLFIYQGSLLAIDIGGAIIPIVLSLYLIKKMKINIPAIIVGILIIGVLTYMTTEFRPEIGIVSEFPYFLLPSFCAVGLTLLIYRDNITSGIPYAYSATTFGVLIGADIVRIPQVLIGLEQARVEMNLPIAAGSIGGAGGLDLVFLAGLLAIAPLFFLASKKIRLSGSVKSPSKVFEENLDQTLNLAQQLAKDGDYSGALNASVRAVDMKIQDVGYKFKIKQSPYVVLDMLQINPYVRNDYWLLLNSSKSLYHSQQDAYRGNITARYIIRELQTIEKRLYAGFMQRIIAYIVDMAIILGMILAIFTIGATTGLFDLSDIMAPETIIWILAFVLWLWIAQAIYFTILEGLWGQTPGKKLLGIIVKTDEMEKCGLMSAFTRNVLRLLDAAMLFYAISFIVMNAYPKRQRIGDKVAMTIVLKA